MRHHMLCTNVTSLASSTHYQCIAFNVFFLVKFSDVNECELDIDDCHSNATCDDVHGSFVCTCNNGFEGNGTSCIGKKQTKSTV